MAKIDLFVDALPEPLFQRLVSAVRSVGAEHIEGNYDTTFWFPIHAKPANIAEECATELCALVRPAGECIGMEWWLGRLPPGKKLPFHTDSDRSLKKMTGAIVHPMWSSILYLNEFPSGPTVIYDQVLGPDGKSWVPPKPIHGKTLPPVPNQYVVFRGDLRHGVLANAERSGTTSRPDELRLTLLVNYWDRRPMAPNCREYDGTIYKTLQEGYSPSIAR